MPTTLTVAKTKAPRPHFYSYPIDQQSATQQIIEGLQQPQKILAPKYFYDTKGAELFDQITRLPAYYLSRAEQEILRRYSAVIAAHTGLDGILIEPGCGTCDKVELLISSLRPRAYVPIDIAKNCLYNAANRMSERFPWLECHAINADFSDDFTLPERLPAGKRIAFYPGSSIGNCEPAAAQAFLRRIHELVGADGGLLIGVDLQKNISQLNAAYNDSQGVTAAFNRNILNHVNRLTGSNFSPSTFDHIAFYDAQLGRIEMHLCSRNAQEVMVGEECISFATGETIHTENSYKYTSQSFCELAAKAGFFHEQTWYDEKKLFSLHYFIASQKIQAP
ncbi:MAG TPA: L-histidine N(alpha)-methyltransferase [Spongiibacteraceae bacterium]|nr:L-histidine N(alpha)-methyltransferase [Spongiibacteraceae bacterium]